MGKRMLTRGMAIVAVAVALCVPAGMSFALTASPSDDLAADGGALTSQSLETAETGQYYASTSISASTSAVTLSLSFRDSAYVAGYDTSSKSIGVYRATSRTGAPLLVGEKNVGTAQSTMFTDTSVSPGTTYYYQVAVKRGGSTTVSYNTEVFEIKTETVAPASLSVKLSGTNAVALSWTKVSGADGYYIYRAEGWKDPLKNNNTFSYTNWPNSPTITITGNTATYTDKNLTPGMPYFYKVYPYVVSSGKARSCGASPIKEIFTVPSTPSVGASLNVTNKDYVKATQKIRVSWNATTKNWSLRDGVKLGCVVERRVGSGAWKVLGKTSSPAITYWNDSKIARAKKYSYRVKPYVTNENGVTTYGAYSKVKTVKTIPAVGNVKKAKKVSKNSWRVYWNKTAGADGYMMWCYRSGGKWTKLKTLPASARSIKVNGLKKGKLYGVAVVPLVKNSGVVSYGTANKTFMLNRKGAKDKVYLTRLG